MEKIKPFISIAIAFIAGGAYVAVTRLIFGSAARANSIYSTLYSTFSLGFVFLVPLGLGALTVFLAPKKFRTSLLYAIFVPWASAFTFSVLAAIGFWEAWICIIMAIPIFLLMSTAGGLLMALVFYLTRSKDSTQSSNLALFIFLLSPYIVTPLELKIPLQTSVRQTHQQIEINASPETVWNHIAAFPKIAPETQHESVFHWVGLPRPVEATLSSASIGGVRRGQWEYGLAFDGIITDWKPNERFTVQLKADTRNLAPSAAILKEIGGEHFDMLDDSYVIERVSDNQVILHLYSTHRLTSHFNFYGGLWTDYFMRDIQNYILQIVKQRCENQS